MKSSALIFKQTIIPTDPVKKHGLALTVWMVALLAFGVPVNAADESVTLCEDGKAKVFLVRDGHADPVSDAAIEELCMYFKRITGAELNVERKAIPLYVGEASQFKGLPLEIPELEKEGFLFKAGADGIYLLGGSELGTQHAVFTLLRDLGCRWIMPGAIGECIPNKATLSLPCGERAEAPDFDYRIVWYAYGCSPEASVRYNDWLRHNRMGKPNIQHGHNLTNTLMRKATFAEHPEYYSLVNGKRAPQQICTANPEVVKLVIESVDEFLDANPGVESYTLCPDDNDEFCECDLCLAQDVGHMDRGGKPSISDRYQIFLNKVLEGIEKNHPEACVTTYSYNRNHTDPPQKVPVNPKTTVFITSSAFCSAHGIGDEFCASRQDFRKLLTEWSGHTKRLIIYEYDPTPYSGALPWPMWTAHIRETPIYKQLGIQGLSFEGQNSWAAYFPNYYVAGQLMWNADQDGEAVFDDMIDSFFGESAAAMNEFYEAMESKISAFEPFVEWGLIRYPELFPTELVDACEKALVKAEQAAAQDITRQRVQMARLSFEEMKAYLSIRDTNRISSYAEYKASVDKLKTSIDDLRALNEDFILADIAHQKTGNAISEQFAPEQGFINRWQICGPFDNPGMTSHDKAFPPEAGVDLSAQYEGKGGKAAWKPNHTADWKAFVDLREEYEQKNDVCAYAACWVTVPDGPREAELRMGSNDSIKAFLNGKEVWSRNVQRGAQVDEDRVTVTLPAGTSQVLLKVCQSGLNWGFYFRIMKPGGDTPLEGIKVSEFPPK